MSSPKLSETVRACVSVVLAIGIACPVAADASQVGAVDGRQAETVQEASKAAPESPTDPTLKLRTAEALRQFEPATDEEYTLGAGDEISIQFPGRSELSAGP